MLHLYNTLAGAEGSPTYVQHMCKEQEVERDREDLIVMCDL